MNRLLAAAWSRVQAEPMATQYLVQEGLLFAYAYGLHLSQDQQTAALTLSGALLTWLTRKAVTPNARAPA